MDKAKAIQQFWSSFGLTAIDEQSAYDEGMELPDKYITYELQTSNFGDPVSLTASLWYYSTSWKEITEKADAIASYIGYGGRFIEVANGGYIWIKLGTPFAQRMATDKDKFRRIVLNITVDFLTAV
jgi:hypothetical protein